MTFLFLSCFSFFYKTTQMKIFRFSSSFLINSRIHDGYPFLKKCVMKCFCSCRKHSWSISSTNRMWFMLQVTGMPQIVQILTEKIARIVIAPQFFDDSKFFLFLYDSWNSIKFAKRVWWGKFRKTFKQKLFWRNEKMH